MGASRQSARGQDGEIRLGARRGASSCSRPGSRIISLRASRSMPVSMIQRVVFQQAVETTGSISHLALILDVRVRDLERWIAGEEVAPKSVFNAAAELIQDSSRHHEKKKPGP